jgi:hypothetical protein
MKINRDKIRPTTNISLDVWDRQTDTVMKLVVIRLVDLYTVPLFMFLDSEALDKENVYKLELE